MTSRARRLGDGRSTARAPSVDSNVSTVRVSGTRKRLSGVATQREKSNDGVVHSRRPTRGPKKRYVESESSDEEDNDHVAADDDDDEDEDDDEDDDDDDEDDDEVDEEHQDTINVGDSDVDMDGLGDEDAEGEAEDMDVDADGEPEGLGEEDAEGDVDMDVVTSAAAPPSIKVSRPPGTAVRGVGRPVGSGKRGRRGDKRRSTGGRKKASQLDEDDDEKPSDEESMAEGEINASVVVAREDDDEADAEGEEEAVPTGEEDAEGEDIEVVDEDDEEDAAGDSDATGSRAGTPDLSKMTRRQRARFEETPQEYMKLSDEVQVKKHFTAEELSMRRAEMARRRRNLSEKRNEEVKAETINKLLKRQAPKTTKKNALADDSGDEDGQGTGSVFIRWVSSKKGSFVGVPSDILDAPTGDVFRAQTGRAGTRKMVEEVS